MSSPFPPDPYTALGVPKDADLAQIRTAHRKLAFKYHPDRIRGDEDEKNKANNEFLKAQQAYELLSDSHKRSRYDDQVKLAELKKEKMMRDASRPTVYTTKTTPASTTVRRETRSDGINVEERAPPTSYFDRDEYDDPLSRASSRKYETGYEKEKKSSPAPKSAERREKVSSKKPMAAEGGTPSKWSTSGDGGISMKTAIHMMAKAAEAKERVKSNHAKSQESRDREKRQNRSEKQSGRRTAYVEDDSSDSDNETAVPKHTSQSTRPPLRPTRMDSESSRSTRPPPMRRGFEDYEDGYDSDEKWERHHRNTRDYIAESKSQRPGLSRNGSDAYVYWGGDTFSSSGRRSGSDSEKRPSSSRRTAANEARARPSMPAQNSAPNNLRPFMETREPQRAKTSAYPVDHDSRPSPPSLNRAQTMPINRPTRKDSAPIRGSNLKHGESTNDSGYYTNSPEMKADSPPPSRGASNKQKSTKYHIVDPDSDGDSVRPSRVTKIIGSDDDGRPRRYRSPEPDRREREREREKDRDRERDRGEREKDRDQRERERERERDRDRDRVRERERDSRPRPDAEARPKATRTSAPTSYPRHEFNRHDMPSPRGSPPSHRNGKLFGELSSDEREASYSYRYDPASVKTAAYQAPSTAGYGNPRFREADDDYSPGSTFRHTVRNPPSHTRRPSAAY